MTVQKTDRWVGANRITLPQALAFALRNAQRVPDAQAFATEQYRICVAMGWDFLLSFGQANEESANLTHSWWVNRLNAVNIGVTGKPSDDAISPTYSSGTESAQAWAYHLALYLGAQASPVVSGYRHLDPHATNVEQAGYVGIAKTLEDLTGRWATDPAYGQAIADRANAINPTASDQGAMPKPTPAPTPGGGTVLYSVAGLPGQIELPVPLIQAILPTSQTNQRPGISRQTPGYWVQHETANTNAGADAAMHARYLANGADGSQVSWHFTVDDHQIYQHIPINEVTWQAADGSGPGNMSGVSCELCVNSDGNKARIRANGEALAGAICKALGLGVDRVKRHYDFNAADPNRHHCPDEMMNENYWPTFVNNVGKIITGVTPVPTPTPTPVPKPTPKPKVTYPAGMDAGIAAELFGAVGTWKYAEGGTLSNLWLDYGKANGVWPRLVDVKVAVDSPTISRTYWQFSSGVTWWRPNASAPLVELKAA